MSADSFHHQVEDKIRRKKYPHDFNDYVDCIDSAGKALLLKPEDFFDFKINKIKQKIQIIQIFLKYWKFSSAKEKQQCFGKHHLENLIINLANSKERNSGINV